MTRAAVTVALCLLSLLLASTTLAAPLRDARVLVDDTLARGAPGSVSVTVFDAHDWARRTGRPDVAVKAWLIGKDNQRHALAEGRTDKRGHIGLTFRTPPVEIGSRRLSLEIAGRPDAIEHTVEIVDDTHLHLRTDRKVFRPGETLSWRVTAMGRVDARPRSADVELEIRDPRGTRMWRGKAKTDATGMIAGRLPLSGDAPLGTWRLEARADGASARVTIDIRPARRPAFMVDTARDGDTVTVTAAHATGEPVQGAVTLEVGETRLTGVLDASGRFIGPDLPTDHAVAVTVTDGAQRIERATVPAESPDADDLDVAIVPEYTPLVPGVRQSVTVVATDNRGRFAAAVPVLSSSTSLRLVASAPGVARYTFVPGDDAVLLHAAVTRPDGSGAGAGSSLNTERRPIRVRADSPVVEAGQPVRISGRSTSKDWDGPAIATLMRRGKPIVSSAVHMRRGRFDATLVPPAGVFGLATVRVHRAGFDLEAGEIRSAHGAALVYLRPTPLAVELSADARHRPGAIAHLGVRVTRDDGRPVGGVGVAAEAVDTRALRLGDPGPHLVEALRGVEIGHASIAGAAFARLLDATPGTAVRLARAATLAALPSDAAAPTIHDDVTARWQAETDRLDGVSWPVGRALVDWPGAIVKWSKGRWQWAMPLDAVLTKMGWDQAKRHDPWGRPTSWSAARRFEERLTIDELVRPIAFERLYALAALLGDGPRAPLRRGRALSTVIDLPPHLRVDPWGHRIRAIAANGDVDLVCPGPDGRIGSADDIRIEGIFRPGAGGGGHGLGARGLYGRGLGSGGSGRAYGGTGMAVRAKAAAVRKRFDETALWRVGLTTDDAGELDVPISLPDSLTTWRVRVEALAPDGAMGAAETRLRTWLPFSVQATMPEHLVEGDRYTIPIVMQNRTDTAATLRVRGRTAGAIDGPDLDRTLVIPPGEVRAERFAIEAKGPGEGRLRLDLFENGEPVDAVERTLTIEGRGRLERAAIATVLEPGSPTITFTAPPAAGGSLDAVLRAYRGPADAALDGLDSLVRAPYGCFEQTSSTTYPTLLVLDLLDPADPDTAKLRAKATDFVAKGYQRLVGYEVEGGGFSWFGEAPANQVLTAYGLVEFADMSRVFPVDPDLITRTVAWLAAQQGDDGGWRPDAKWLHDWSAVQGEISTTAYIAWALAEAGDARGPTGDIALERARGFLRANRDALLADAYLSTLWALAESKTERSPIVSALAARAATDGHLPAGRTLFGTGRQADVQTTALWTALRARGGQTAQAADSRRWLWSARGDAGGWGTTQATVLALRAVVETRTSPVTGPLAMMLDGEPIGALDLDGVDIPTLSLPADLNPGTHTLSIDGGITGALDVDLRQSWRGADAPAAEANGLIVELQPDRRSVARGETVNMQLTLRNPGAEAIAMPTVEVPIPPGFAADRGRLEALVTDGTIERFEILGRRFDLYLTDLRPGEAIALPYALRADATCSVTHRGVLAYAYYSPDVRGWSAPFTLSATPGAAVGTR